MLHNIKKVYLSLVRYPFLVLFFIVGCTHNQSISSRYEISPNKPDGFALSKNVILVADNQLNYLYGDPFWMRSELVDKFVRVAIRPVQQDLFGQDILRWVLKLYGSQLPIIHLGDATNIACTGEFESFLEIMSTAKKPWVMAPGNHDAYLLGNTQVNLGEWTDACKGSGEPMTKDRFVHLYLTHLQKQYNDFRLQYNGDLPSNGHWRSNLDGETFLRSVAWKIDEKKPWCSYVVQELNLSLPNSSMYISAILIDTNQFATEPNLVLPNAGICGDVQPEQLKIIESWLKDNPTGQKITIFMSHHPYGDLQINAREVINSLRKKYSVPLYISAHTHKGQYFVKGGSEGWLELNVGSIVDWPIEFRTFSIHEDHDDLKKIVFRTKLFRIPECWDKLESPQAPQCDISWEAKPGDPDYYLLSTNNYSPDPKKTQENLMNSTLHIYKRLFKNVPSAIDNKIWPECCTSDEAVLQEIDNALSNYSLEQKKSLLITLGEFDRKRTPKDPMALRNYRVWQAVWASKYDDLQSRKPESSDSYIIYSRR